MSRAYVVTPARTRLCTTPPPIAPAPMTPKARAAADETAWAFIARASRRRSEGLAANERRGGAVADEIERRAFAAQLHPPVRVAHAIAAGRRDLVERYPIAAGHQQSRLADVEA